MASKGKKGKTKSKMKMTSYESNHESRHKTHMRIITLVIACIVILGLVIIFPFADASVGAAEAEESVAASSDTGGAVVELPEVSVTSQGAGMFTLKNAALIGGGFAVGFLLGEIFRKVNKYRERQTDGQR
jgi:type III secretory pathway component EscT